MSSPIMLDGSESYNPNADLITYSWSALSLPLTSTAVLDYSTSPQPSLIPDVEGDYIFKLIVSDPQASSTPDLVTVTAESGVGAPNADAGRDQTASLGETVALDGLASGDPNDLPLTFAWTFWELPAASVLQNADIVAADTARVAFMPNVVGSYRLDLSVDNRVIRDGVIGRSNWGRGRSNWGRE